MPFNFPIQQDRSGELLGQGLADAMQNLVEARWRRQAEAEHDQDRAHMLQSRGLEDALHQAGARQAGITPGTAPQENLDLPVWDEIPKAQEKLPFDEQMQPHPQGLAEAMRGQMNDVASPGFNSRAGARPPMGGTSAAAMTLAGAQRLGGPREERSPSVAQTTPGAFSISGGGFHSPLKDTMGGGAGGAMQQGAPAGAPMTSRQSQGGGTAPATQPSHTLHMRPSYEQLTPDYYMDRTAPGPTGAARAAELGRQKEEAQIAEMGARGEYYRGRANAPKPSRYQIVQDDNGFYRVNMDDPRDVTPLSANGNPLVPKRAQRNRQVIQSDAGDFFVNDDGSLSPATYGGKQLQPRQPRSTSGESPDIASTRRDLKDIQGQQIRAENQAKSLKSEQRAFATTHPRATKGMPAARTAADSGAVQDYNDLGAQIDSAEARSGRLTRSADSTLNVLHRKRSGPAVSFSDVEGGSTSSPAAATLDPDTITDDELKAAHRAGKRTPEDVISYVGHLRQPRRP